MFRRSLYTSGISRSNASRVIRAPRGWLKSPKAVLALRRQLRAHRFDVAIDLQCLTKSAIAAKLLDVTQASLFAAVEQCRPGNRLGDVSHAVQETVEAEGMSIVRSLVGHGIGRAMHEPPSVPNYGQRGRGLRLREGLVIAIEPMFSLGGDDVWVLEDGWSVATVDGSRAVHMEHTVAITSQGPRILAA